MSTLEEVADAIQATLNDAGASTWSQAQIEQWVNEAIADYTQHFQREVETTIATMASDQKYDLPPDFQRMLRVELPDGESPPSYLIWRDRRRSDFWNVSGHYDIVYHRDDGVVDEIWLSSDPGTDTLRCWYLALHDSDLDSGDDVTVPADHHHLLHLFVFWRAYQMLAVEEAKAPTSNSSLILAQLAQSARAAWLDYRRELEKLLAESARSGTQGWRPNHLEGVY